MKLSSDLTVVLRQMADLQTQMRPDAPWRYRSYEELVLSEGIEFDSKFEMRAERYGEYKECFQNSYWAAVENDWAYVEGYAASLIPVLHAWCLDENGTIVETTWDEPTEYVGIVMDPDWVFETCVKTGYWGVLANDWKNDAVLIRHGVVEEMDRWRRSRDG